MPRKMLSLLFCLIILGVFSNADLLSISSQNSCIKRIVSEFIHQNDCSKLPEETKSKLSIQMSNCLFLQVGKPVIECSKISQCEFSSDEWLISKQIRNTFTTFFTHIDNLCHFYWDVSKAQRTEDMISALLNSASLTEKSLNKNAENTEMIVKLQNDLRLQMVKSIATQQQMNELISNSSLKITKLTNELQSSLSKISSQIDQHFRSVVDVLSTINDAISSLNSFQVFLLGEIKTVSSIIYFLSFSFIIFICSVFSQKVRICRNKCLYINTMSFLVEFFISASAIFSIEIKWIRYLTVMILILLILTTKSRRNEFEEVLNHHLNTEKLKRVVRKALKDQGQVYDD